MTQIVTSPRTKRRKPVRPPKPQPIRRIVYSPSPKTRAAIARWQRS